IQVVGTSTGSAAIRLTSTRSSVDSSRRRSMRTSGTATVFSWSIPTRGSSSMHVTRPRGPTRSGTAGPRESQTNNSTSSPGTRVPRSQRLPASGARLQEIANLGEQLHLVRGLGRRGRLGSLRRGPQAVDLPEQDEDGEGQDQEADDVVQEHAVVERRGTCLLGGGQRVVVLAGEGQEQVREVDLPDDEAERRHEHVVHERGDDLPERRS